MNFRLMRKALVAALAVAAGRADAQSSSQRAVVLADGDTIQLVHRSMFERGPLAKPPGRRVDFLYHSRIAASDSAARHQQADRAAQILGTEAVELGVRLLSVGVCDTQACAQGRQPASHWFLYERAGGGWRRVFLR